MSNVRLSLKVCSCLSLEREREREAITTVRYENYRNRNYTYRRDRVKYLGYEDIGTPGNVARNDEAIVSAVIADVAARVAHPLAYESWRGF